MIFSFCLFNYLISPLQILLSFPNLHTFNNPRPDRTPWPAAYSPPGQCAPALWCCVRECSQWLALQLPCHQCQHSAEKPRALCGVHRSKTTLQWNQSWFIESAGWGRRQRMSLELSRGGPPPPPSHWIVTCHFVTQQEASVETFSTWTVLTLMSGAMVWSW